MYICSFNFFDRIGRNLKHFETWSTHQSCEQVSFADLPIEVKADVLDVFNVNGKLPKCWVDEVRSSVLGNASF